MFEIAFQTGGMLKVQAGTVKVLAVAGAVSLHVGGRAVSKARS